MTSWRLAATTSPHEDLDFAEEGEIDQSRGKSLFRVKFCMSISIIFWDVVARVFPGSRWEGFVR